MVRGELARKAMDVAVNFEDIKYTRVDIRVDISMSGEVQGLPRKIYDTYKGKFPTKLIESNTGDTLYCGSRESGEYIRIYDKSVSYGYCEGSGQVWRFEVEYKNRSAERLAVYLEDNKFENMADVVWASMRKKDLPAPRIGKVVDIRGAYTSLTSAEQKLEWIGRQVRPTVQFLVSLGLVEEVREQLGLFDLES
jgi:DNA relaxase NicK